MFTMDLKEYVKETRQRGADDQDIRAAMRQAGWGDFEIDVAFQDANQEQTADDKEIASYNKTKPTVPGSSWKTILIVIMVTILILGGLAAVVLYYPPVRQLFQLGLDSFNAFASH